VATRDELAEYERTFRRSGLPLFIEDHSASKDVFNRAAPFLALVFLAEMIGATDLDWPVGLNIAAAIAGLGILVTAFGAVNRWQGRPFWSFPEQIGTIELAAFVLAPALLPLIFGGQWRQVIGITLGNLILLWLVYLVVGYGLLATIGWALARIVDELAASLTRLMRALPMLLIFSLVLFINAEMWQVFAVIPNAFFVLVVVLFVGLGAAFLALRLPGEVRTLEASAVGEGPPLARRQKVNVGLTLIVSQMLQVLVVSAGVGLFFVVLGALAIRPDVVDTWGIPAESALLSVELFESDLVVTETLLKVATGIAAITGLYYAISILTDATYRKEFLDGVIDEMRGTFAARVEYLRLRSTTVESKRQ
jgi:hypothetical protein